jgi:hypothetical protein
MLCYIDEYITYDLGNSTIENQICFNGDLANIQDITMAMSALDQNNTDFTFFDLGLSDYDIAILDQLVIDNMGFYTNYGQIYSLESEITEFIKTLSLNGLNNQSAVHVSSLINNISKNILNASGYESGLVDVRGFIEGLNDGYFPNWHVDKSIEEVIDINHQLKSHPCGSMFIFLLKGNTTIYHPTNPSLREQFYQLANESAYTYGYDYNLEYIKGEGLDNIFSINNTYSAKFGQGSVHLTGKECGAIHAVPMSQERLFIRVFPGISENIASFKEVVYTNLY